MSHWLKAELDLYSSFQAYPPNLAMISKHSQMANWPKKNTFGNLIEPHFRVVRTDSGKEGGASDRAASESALPQLKTFNF